MMRFAHHDHAGICAVMSQRWGGLAGVIVAVAIIAMAFTLRSEGVAGSLSPPLAQPARAGLVGGSDVRRDDSRQAGGIDGEYEEICHEEAGDCFSPNPTPGCNDPDCCALVCAEDPFCCEFDWDSFCVQLAEELCIIPPLCPAEGSCFEMHEGIGCDDPECCELMCEVDPFCCSVLWDEMCARQAMEVCNMPPCELDNLEGIPEPEECAKRTNDGCNLNPPVFTPIHCGEQYVGTAFAGSPRDTDWYAIDLVQTTHVTWTVTSEFPSQALIITGECAHAVQIVQAAYGGGCTAYSVSACLEPGTYYLFISPATTQGPLRGGARCPEEPDPIGEEPEESPYGVHYMAGAECAECPAQCPADLNGDGTVDGADLGILLASWGACADCKDCPADLNGDCTVDGADLGLLLAAWGPCPE